MLLLWTPGAEQRPVPGTARLPPGKGTSLPSHAFLPGGTMMSVRYVESRDVPLKHYLNDTFTLFIITGGERDWKQVFLPLWL